MAQVSRSVFGTRIASQLPSNSSRAIDAQRMRDMFTDLADSVPFLGEIVIFRNAAAWTASETHPAGRILVENETGRFKFSNGSTYANTPFAQGGVSEAAVTTLIRAAFGNPTGAGAVSANDGSLLNRPLDIVGDANAFDWAEGAPGVIVTTGMLAALGRPRELTPVLTSGVDVVTLNMMTALSNVGLNTLAPIANPVEIRFPTLDASILTMGRPISGYLQLRNTTNIARNVALAEVAAGRMRQAWAAGAQALAVVPVSGRLLLQWHLLPGMGLANADLILWNFVTVQV